MDAPTRAPGYDLFKLIVAIFLLILALILMWTPTTPSPTSTATPLFFQPTPFDQTQGATVPASPTSLPPTVTASPSPSPTITDASEPTVTPHPSPTMTPAVGSTATPIAGLPVTACSAATSRARLQVGTNATLLRRLNFRSSPGIRDNLLRTNIPGTQVEVIGGPECVLYWTGAYLWWQIQLPDGSIGWSAEGSLHSSFYFMEPNQ